MCECVGALMRLTFEYTCVYFLYPSVWRLQKLRHDRLTQGQHQTGTVDCALQRTVAVGTVHGAEQDHATAASRRHYKVHQRCQGIFFSLFLFFRMISI